MQSQDSAMKSLGGAHGDYQQAECPTAGEHMESTVALLLDVSAVSTDSRGQSLQFARIKTFQVEEWRLLLIFIRKYPVLEHPNYMETDHSSQAIQTTDNEASNGTELCKSIDRSPTDPSHWQLCCVQVRCLRNVRCCTTASTAAWIVWSALAAWSWRLRRRARRVASVASTTVATRHWTHLDIVTSQYIAI